VTRRGALATVVLLVGACSGAPATMGPDPLPEGKPVDARPPDNTVGGFRADLPEAVLMPGAETTPCWILPLDVSGPSRFVGGAHLTVGKGLHHGNIVARKKSGDGVRRCGPGESSSAELALDVVNGGAVLFASTTQISGEEWQRFPTGMAFALDPDLEIVARMHYLNAGTQPLTIAPKYEWFTVDAAAVTTELAPFAWDFYDIDIPPLGEATARGQCFFDGPMHVVTIMPHMHRMGIGAAAGFLGGPRDGQRWFDSPGYDPESGLIRQFEPALDLGQDSVGRGVWFSCTWQNQLDKRLSYGLGDDEMCTMFGYAYPPSYAYSGFVRNGACAVIPARP